MPEKPQINRFGEKLRYLRKKHALTLSELGQQLGYTTHTYISEIENNKKTPTTEFVLSIAYLFNVSTDELLKDELAIDEDTEEQEK